MLYLNTYYDQDFYKPPVIDSQFDSEANTSNNGDRSFKNCLAKHLSGLLFNTPYTIDYTTIKTNNVHQALIFKSCQDVQL